MNIKSDTESFSQVRTCQNYLTEKAGSGRLLPYAHPLGISPLFGAKQTLTSFFGWRFFRRLVVTNLAFQRTDRKNRAFLAAYGKGNGANCHDVLQNSTCKLIDSRLFVKKAGKVWMYRITPAISINSSNKKAHFVEGYLMWVNC
jgi:hypothetical protein